ncbi:type III polyketide synthase [Allosphingosinicella indica]|uniref:(2-(2,4-dihydroxy-6-methylphenyl)-2-oxoethyl)-4-hydroxy-2-pyrone synthase n=1 Tax=Allosphingosinicella indica TaxID=941907 RepID=A0A1X7FZU5_9SPHN|nr:type III polyketide synthase [Allosphingosinicella indica]SMF61622.1 (2-(2,4-dihydroxy-6-methylphenyl)-2-oxoethyl)-4-hydroxy-2-pyrone synthase [Allosphingosinicella indica]
MTLPHSPVALLSLARAVPHIVLPQAEAKALARRLFGGRAAHFDRLAGVFDNAGIDTRHIVQPVDWYVGEHGWASRNQAYVEAADALYVEAATAALAEAGVSAAEVDTLVTVSTTGIATPSIEARVAGAMGFRADAERVPVFGLGCAGGVTGLALAARLAAAGRTVLFVTVELCSIAIRLDKLSKANIVATALFGDGAAAAVLRPGEGGIASVGAGAELLWPDTLGIMGWDVEDPGLGVVFDRAIPPFVEENMAAGVATLLERCGTERGAIDRFTCHPGGAKVIAALEESLALGESALDHERAVLRTCGNMSAPTVLFVLRRLLDAGFAGQTMLLALGPGFTASGLTMRVG